MQRGCLHAGTQVSAQSCLDKTNTWVAGCRLELIRPVLSQHARSVGSARLDSNEVPTRRCCVCTAGLKPPELRCSNNFNLHFSIFFSPPSCSSLLCSRHRINRANFSGQTKDRRRASLTPKQTSLKNSRGGGGVYSSAVEPELSTPPVYKHMTLGS